MELLDFSFRFPAFYGRMGNPDGKLRKGYFQLLCDVLASVVKVAGIKEKEFLRFVQQDEHFSECYDGMFILFRTGLRIGEFCGLTLKDIDLEKRTINVNHQLQYVGNRGKYIEKTKTEAGTRVLPMSDEVYAAFKRVVQNRKKPKVEEMIDGYTGFLFLDKRGKPMMPYQ